MRRELEYVPIEEATKPREGEVMVDRWWVVHPELGLTFYRMDRNYRAPQCNHNEAIARSIQQKMYPDHDVILVATVFLGHHLEGY